MSGPEKTTKGYVDRKISQARLAILWERAWDALYPAIMVLGLFALAVLSGLLPSLPDLGALGQPCNLRHRPGRGHSSRLCAWFSPRTGSHPPDRGDLRLGASPGCGQRGPARGWRAATSAAPPSGRSIAPGSCASSSHLKIGMVRSSLVAPRPLCAPRPAHPGAVRRRGARPQRAGCAARRQRAHRKRRRRRQRRRSTPGWRRPAIPAGRP